MSEFLSPDELEQLTGYRRPSYQTAWLQGRDPTALLGHTNAQTTRRYTRGLETTTVEPLRRKAK